MSPAQTALYWREWSACKAVRKARGLDYSDAARHALHRAALECEENVSHLDFTNGQFDKVLAKFRSFSRPSDLKSQLRAQEQPAERKEQTIEKCYELLEELQFHGKKFEGENALERYLNGTSWAVLKKSVKNLNDKEAAKLFGVLHAQVKREVAKSKKAEAAAPAAPTDSSPDKPF